MIAAFTSGPRIALSNSPRVGLVLVLLGACTSSFDPIATLPRNVQAVSPTQIAGIVGGTAKPTPTILVTDAILIPLEGVRLSVDITSGGGSLGATTLVTGRDGIARVDWTLGTTAGLHTIIVRTAGASPLVFTATAGHGPAASILVEGGTGQVAAPGTTLPQPLTVKVQDAFANPVPGETVTFSVISGAGTLEGVTAVTDESGRARSGRWTLGPTLGVQEIRAQVGAIQTTATARSYVRVCAEPVPGTCTSPMELVFARLSDGEIYRIRADSSGLTKLTTSGLNRSPFWSPDGRRIAFIHGVDESTRYLSDVWFMDADGSNPVQRTMSGGYASVAWSPDGTRLAVSDEGLYFASMSVMDAAIGGITRITVEGARRPAWSPDGKKIAFIRPSGDDGYETVWVIDADGTGERQLTSPGGFIDDQMAWTPDGLEIIYTDAGKIYAARSDGSARRHIPSDALIQGVQVSPDGKWLAVTFEMLPPRSLGVGYLPIGGGLVTSLVDGAFDPTWRR